MDEFKELVLVWAIALSLMVAGIGIAHYATEEAHFSVDATGIR